MNDQRKTKVQLIKELTELRSHLADLEMRAKETLSLERGFYKMFFDNLPTYFVAIDAQGKTVSMNQSMRTVLGYSAEEVRGLDYIDTFIPERERESLSNLERSATRRGRVPV